MTSEQLKHTTRNEGDVQYVVGIARRKSICQVRGRDNTSSKQWTYGEVYLDQDTWGKTKGGVIAWGSPGNIKVRIGLGWCS